MPGKPDCRCGGSLRGAAAPPHERSIKAFDQDPRCDASLVFCLVAAVQATRDSVFEGGFPDRQFVALLTPSALSILLEWGFTPSNSPAAAAFCYTEPTRNTPEFSEEEGEVTMILDKHDRSYYFVIDV